MNGGIPGEKSQNQVKKTWFLGNLLRWTTVPVSLLTVLSGWGSLFNPAKHWYVALTGLGFPALFLINLLLLVLWLVRGRLIAWVPLAALLITVVKMPTIIQLGGSSEKPDYIEGQSDEIKMLSFNVRLFDLYNWTHSHETKAKIFDLLEYARPNILCLQEFYSSDRKNQDNVKAMHDLLDFKSHHVEYPINLYGTDHWGIATFSTFPIVNKGVLYFNAKTANICIYSDIKIQDDTVRVYNCHLQSVRFEEKEYKFLESIGNDKEDEPTGEEAARRTKNIITRLKYAFIERAKQADLIRAHIAKSPYPVMICGDFNDTPSSYSYKVISEGLLDAFRESGSGLGTTYAGPIPGLRIDYILHSPEITSYDFSIGKMKLSDHFPLSVNLVIKR